MIRRADPSEAEDLAALHRSSIAAHCSAAYTDAQINAWTAMLRPEGYLALIGDAAVLVATDGAEDRLVGVGVCSPEIGLVNATLNALAFYRLLGYGDEVSSASRLPSGIELPCVAMSKRLSRS